MKELALHILDILHNSIAAGATLVEVTVVEDTMEDILEFSITDNGKGMSPEFVQKVIDPFTTSRTTRKVGLGIPLLKQAAEECGGGLSIESEVGVGTTVTARFVHSHIDRQPLGDMAETMHGVMTSFENVDFVYTHTVDGNTFSVDTREIKKILGGVPLNAPEVLLWLLEYLRDGENSVQIGGCSI